MNFLSATNLALAALRYGIDHDSGYIAISQFGARRDGIAYVREPLSRIRESLGRWRRLVPAQGANLDAARHLLMLAASTDDQAFGEQLLTETQKLMQTVVGFVRDIECEALSKSGDASRVNEVRQAIESAAPQPPPEPPPAPQPAPTPDAAPDMKATFRADAWRLAALGFATNNPALVTLAADSLSKCGDASDLNLLNAAVKKAADPKGPR